MLLLTVYGYLSVRKYNSYRETIHADAKFIVKIDADQLYRSLAVDYLGNLSYYRNKGARSVESGLSIPAQIFIYTVKSKSSQTYFCALPVADTLLLKSFVKQKLGITMFKNMGQYTAGKSAHSRIHIAFNAHTFVAVYSFDGENVADVTADLLNKRNLLSDKDEKIAKLKTLTSHLAYVSGDYTGTGDFKDGQLHVEGDFNNTAFGVSGKTFDHRTFNKDAVVKMWLSAKPAPDKNFKEIKVKGYDIYPDSLLKYCNGYFDLEVKSPVHQTDTVITYVYNDNFEKEETTTPRIVKVPGVNCSISGDAGGLMNYMSKAAITNNGMINKELFPLYKLYIKRNGTTVLVNTDQKEIVSAARERTPYFFCLDVDFDKLKSQEQFALFKKYIAQLNRLVIKAKPQGLGNLENTERNHFEMDLYFKRKDVNALGQLR